MAMTTASLMLAFLGTASAAVSPLAVQHAQAIHSSSASILSQLQADPSAEELSAMQAQLHHQMAQLQQLSGLLQQQQPTEEQPTAVSMLQTSTEKKTAEKGVMATELWIHATRAYADWVVVCACWLWLSTAPAELYLARQSDTVEKFRKTYKKTSVMAVVFGLMQFNWGGFQGELFEMYLIRREAEHAAHAEHTTNLHAEGGHADKHADKHDEHKDEHKEDHKEDHKQQKDEHKKEKHASFLQLTNEPAHGAHKQPESLEVFEKMDMAIRPWNWASQYFEHVAVNLEFTWISAQLTIALARVAAAHKTKDKHAIEHATDEAVEVWIEFQQIWGMATTLHAMCEMHSYHDYHTMEDVGIKTFKDQVAYGYAPYNGSPLYWFPVRGPFKPMEALIKKLGAAKKPAAAAEQKAH